MARAGKVYGEGQEVVRFGYRRLARGSRDEAKAGYGSRDEAKAG